MMTSQVRFSTCLLVRSDAVVCTGVTTSTVTVADERKLQYALAAVRAPSPFVNKVELEVAIDEAWEWQAQKTAQQVMDERENMVVALERADKLMRESGAVAGWFDGCHPDIAQVLCLLVAIACSLALPVAFVRSAKA